MKKLFILIVFLLYGILIIPYNWVGSEGCRHPSDGVTVEKCDEKEHFGTSEGRSPMNKLRRVERGVNLSTCCFAAEGQGLRVVSLAPSTTEILFALGLDEEIVGVSSFCNYPPEAQEKEKIGTFSQPNIEKILSLRPDIIFCTGLEQAPVIAKLKQLNLKLYVSDPSNIEELFDSIKEMAAFTNRDREANALIDKMKKDIEEITSRTELIPEEEKMKVFVEFWNDPLMSAGRDSFIDELIGLAGGINIAHDTQRAYSYFSPEQVIKRDPDCIVLAYMVNEDAASAIRERLGWKEISAVKNNRIYNDINPDILLRPGPRLSQGLTELHKRLYP